MCKHAADITYKVLNEKIFIRFKMLLLHPNVQSYF